MNKKSYHILLSEDDPNLGLVLKEFLELKGHLVTWCKDGAEALSSFFQADYDLCILDIMMPKMDGFTLAKGIKAKDPDIPLVFLTAKGMEEDKIKGFKTGCDDYITKPFSKDELILRISAIMKRASSEQTSKPDSSSTAIGEYTFEYSKRLLTHGSDQRKLTYKEAEILHLLSARKNEVLPRDWAQTKVWGDDNYFIGRSMDVFISKLRKYLSNDSKISIENIHGSGFILKVDQ